MPRRNGGGAFPRRRDCWRNRSGCLTSSNPDYIETVFLLHCNPLIVVIARIRRPHYPIDKEIGEVPSELGDAECFATLDRGHMVEARAGHNGWAWTVEFRTYFQRVEGWRVGAVSSLQAWYREWCVQSLEFKVGRYRALRGDAAARNRRRD